MTGPEHRHDAIGAPLDVSRVNGEVAVTGPGRAAVSLTPNAARTSARRLLDAADAEGGAEEIDLTPGPGLESDEGSV